jgi:hypothetical protein
MLVWAGWTIAAWLRAGPVSITEYRDTGSASWIAARVYEVVMVAVSIAVLGFVVRSCRRQGRLTWDAQLCIAGALAYWQDPLANFVQPIFLYSSNWINLNAWCSQAPFVVNADCGRVPEPVLFIGLVYGFGLPAAAILGGFVLRGIARRFPDITPGKLIAGALVVGMVVDLLFEVPVIRLNLWHYPGFPDSFALFGGQHRYPLFLSLCAALSFGVVSVVRHFKDDRGRTILERGLDDLSPRRATLTSLLATIGLLQLCLVAINVILIFGGLYSGPWSGEPAHVINGVCDTAGFSQTRYGTCPGDPGYRAPLRHLPGPNPPVGLNR